MLARVRRIEAVRAPALSPIAQAFGSFDMFAAWAEDEMATGTLDSRDFPIVVLCLKRWDADGTWGRAQ